MLGVVKKKKKKKKKKKIKIAFAARPAWNGQLPHECRQTSICQELLRVLGDGMEWSGNALCFLRG
jgi:hypothetical protein